MDRGMAGNNEGLPMGFPKLSQVIFDVQRGRYDLIAGKTSSGKTTFTDHSYVISPFYQSLLNPHLKVEVLYFSLEISDVSKFGNIASRILFDRYGMIVEPNKLFSRGKYRLPSEVRQLLEDCKPIFDKLESIMFIHDNISDSSGMINRIHEFAQSRGQVKQGEQGLYYVPNDPNQYLIVVVDNVNLMSTSKNLTTLKDTIDDFSKRFLMCKNLYNLTGAIIQQLNADINDPKRLALKRFDPIADDVETTKRTTKDCEVMIALYDPLEAGVPNHRGYDIGRFDGRFRQIQVLKNRYGKRGDRVGMLLRGEVGLFTELPSPSEIREEDYLKITQWQQ